MTELERQKLPDYRAKYCTVRDLIKKLTDLGEEEMDTLVFTPCRENWGHDQVSEVKVVDSLQSYFYTKIRGVRIT